MSVDKVVKSKNKSKVLPTTGQPARSVGIFSLVEIYKPVLWFTNISLIVGSMGLAYSVALLSIVAIEKIPFVNYGLY